MSTDMTVFQDADASTELAPEFNDLVAAGMGDDLGAGIGGNYSILSIRGGKFRVKYQGNETPLLNEKGEPVGSVEAVIIKANPYLTKQYYAKKFAEGDSDAPVCFSTDGKVPSPNVDPENRQHTNCSLCPQNRFGSRITDAGTKVKACQDNKKLALAPLGDLENKAFGGPMLFRVPASALKDLLAFNNVMSARGFPYNSVAVRIGLDIETSYPKPTFKAIRPLNSEEAAVVMEMYASDAVERLLADFGDVTAPAPVAAADGAFEQEPEAQPAPTPVVKAAAPPPVVKVAPKPAVVKAAPAAAAKPAATPAPPPARAAKPVVAKPAPVVVAEEPAEAEAEPEPTTSMDDDIANILSELNATPA